MLSNDFRPIILLENKVSLETSNAQDEAKKETQAKCKAEQEAGFCQWDYGCFWRRRPW